jgi:hypothetical protein
MAAWRLDGKPRTSRRLASMRTAPYRHPKTGCCLFWPT